MSSYNLRSAVLFLDACVLVFAALLLPGCGSEAWWGEGLGAVAEVSTPPDGQAGVVPIYFSLRGSDDSVAVAIRYSSDGGSTFFRATPAAESASLEELRMETEHTFLWDTGRDLPDEEVSVIVRVQPFEGTSAQTGMFVVDNRRAVVIADPEEGVMELLFVGGSAGVESVGEIEAGQDHPGASAFVGDYVVVTYSASKNVGCFRLDRGTQAITSCGLAAVFSDEAPRKLASDGQHLFVLDSTSGRLSTLVIDHSVGIPYLMDEFVVPRAREITAHGGRIYIATAGDVQERRDGEIVVFEAESGGRLLRAPVPSVRSVVEPGPLVFVDDRLFAFSARSGAIREFIVADDGSLIALPRERAFLALSETSAVVTNGESLYVIDRSAGELIELSTATLQVTNRQPIEAGVSGILEVSGDILLSTGVLAEGPSDCEAQVSERLR